MKLPGLPAAGRQGAVWVQTRFGGIDRRPGAVDGALRDMLNLSGREFPLLSPRPRRGLLRQLAAPKALGCRGRDLFWLDGDGFYYEGVRKGTVSARARALVLMGERVIILPDMLVYDGETETFGSLGAMWTGERLQVEVWDGGCALCAADAGWDELFAPGDGVLLRGSEALPGGETAPLLLRSVSAGRLELDGGVLAVPDGTVLTGALSLAREVPELELACVCGNRLWGCVGKGIYASKLGDPRNFQVFDGASTDAWQSETLDGGSFTGCASFLGSPVFFKEAAIYKVYGDRPSTFAWTAYPFLGVRAGCERSVQVVNNAVYYLSPAGPAAYGGSRPVPIGACLGEGDWQQATAGTDGLRYYLSMSDGAAFALWVYDTELALWHREDGLQGVSFARPEGGGLCVLGYGEGQGQLLCLAGGGTEEAALPWMAEFQDMTACAARGGSANRKGLRRLQLRLELEAGASLEVAVQYDSDGVWRRVRQLSAMRKQSVALPLALRRCDHFRLRLQGQGGMRLYSLAVTRYGGSER